MEIFRELFPDPPAVTNATNPSQLLPFLESENIANRMAAARKMGDLGDPAAVSILARRFAKEPYDNHGHDAPGVKKEIVGALRRIGGLEAKSALVEIAKQYWQAGPQSRDKMRAWRDADYRHVTLLVLESLQDWCEDDEVFDLAKGMALDENIPVFLTREFAWVLYLKGRMKREGIVSEEEAALFLVDFLEEMGIEGEAYKIVDGVRKRTSASIRTAGVSRILKSYGESALAAIREEKKKTPSSEVSRLHALGYAGGRVNDGIKERLQYPE